MAAQAEALVLAEATIQVGFPRGRQEGTVTIVISSLACCLAASLGGEDARAMAIGIQGGWSSPVRTGQTTPAQGRQDTGSKGTRITPKSGSGQL